MGLFDIFSKKSAEEYYQEGEAFWDKEEYSEAYMCYCEAAKQRHSKAQYSLGYCLRRGIACQKDIPSAIAWLEKAEKQGHVSAILELAYIYNDQEEIFYNKRKAIEYYTKAANMGNASAEFNLAFFYHSGDGVPQDIKKACALWKSAADKGHESAMHNYEVVTYSENDLQAVALDYIYGRDGTQVDVQKGIDLLEKGISLPNENAFMCYGLVKMAGVEGYVESNFDEGLKLLIEAAKSGCYEAYIYIMQIYKFDTQFTFEGKEIGDFSKNYTLAGKYAVEIADEADETTNLLSNGEIYANAAWAYYYGYGVELNLHKAYEYIKKSNPCFYHMQTTAQMINLLSEKGFSF